MPLAQRLSIWTPRLEGYSSTEVTTPEADSASAGRTVTANPARNPGTVRAKDRTQPSDGTSASTRTGASTTGNSLAAAPYPTGGGASPGRRSMASTQASSTQTPGTMSNRVNSSGPARKVPA